MKRPLVFVVSLALAVPAWAHHRQTPPIVAISGGGADATLARVRAGWRRMAIVLDNSQLNPSGWLATPNQVENGHQIFRENWIKRAWEDVSRGGENQNPTISLSGVLVAWDTDCTVAGAHCPLGGPGRQVILWEQQTGFHQVTQDPTGTSVNPAISGSGAVLAFESLGDLAGTGTSGVRQIFLSDSQGVITQLTQGHGASKNASLTDNGRLIVFESTNDDSGADSGTVQIWLSTVPGTPTRITRGAAPSRLPGISPDGRFVVFESTAAVAGDGHDTGVSQIFAYDVRSQQLTQVTHAPLGCAGASIDIAQGWRVAFACHGQGFFHLLPSNQRFKLPVTGGDTEQVVAEGGAHFIEVSTTANLLTGGTTPQHRMYRINLFKLPATPVPVF